MVFLKNNAKVNVLIKRSIAPPQYLNAKMLKFPFFRFQFIIHTINFAPLLKLPFIIFRFNSFKIIIK